VRNTSIGKLPTDWGGSLLSGGDGLLDSVRRVSQSAIDTPSAQCRPAGTGPVSKSGGRVEWVPVACAPLPGGPVHHESEMVAAAGAPRRRSRAIRSRRRSDLRQTMPR